MDAYKAAYVQMTIEVLRCFSLQSNFMILILAAEAVEVAETFKKVCLPMLKILCLANDILDIFFG